MRAIRALLREIVRALRHDLNFVALCRGLMAERKETSYQDVATVIKVSASRLLARRVSWDAFERKIGRLWTPKILKGKTITWVFKY